MTPSNVTIIFSGFSTSLSTILVDNLPLVVGIMVGLIGLGILIRYVVRWFGGHEGSLTYEMEADHDLRNQTWRVGGNEM